MSRNHWTMMSWIGLVASIALTLLAAWKSRAEALRSASEIDRVRSIQVQRGERIGAIEARVSALEAPASRARIVGEVTSDIARAELTEEGRPGLEFVCGFVADFRTLAAGMPQKE